MENKTCFACFFREEFQLVRIESPNKKPGTRNWGQSLRDRVFHFPAPRGKMSPGCIPGFFQAVAWPSEAVRGPAWPCVALRGPDKSIRRHPETGRKPILQTERRSVSVCSVCSVVKRPEAPRDEVAESLLCSRQRLRTQRQVCCTIS